MRRCFTMAWGTAILSIRFGSIPRENPRVCIPPLSRRIWLNMDLECSRAEPGDISSLMPATFGEVLLRIYTRDVRFFGLIQHGYRLILQGLPSSPEEEPPTSGSDQPSTPTRVGTTSPARSSGGRVFSNNSFTTVKPGYIPPSPTAEHVKRRREDDTVQSPRKKLRS